MEGGINVSLGSLLTLVFVLLRTLRKRGIGVERRRGVEGGVYDAIDVLRSS